MYYFFQRASSFSPYCGFSFCLFAMNSPSLFRSMPWATMRYLIKSPTSLIYSYLILRTFFEFYECFWLAFFGTLKAGAFYLWGSAYSLFYEGFIWTYVSDFFCSINGLVLGAEAVTFWEAWFLVLLALVLLGLLGLLLIRVIEF